MTRADIQPYSSILMRDNMEGFIRGTYFSKKMALKHMSDMKTGISWIIFDGFRDHENASVYVRRFFARFLRALFFLFAFFLFVFFFVVWLFVTTNIHQQQQTTPSVDYYGEISNKWYKQCMTKWCPQKA